jgi:hypothetical protein
MYGQCHTEETIALIKQNRQGIPAWNKGIPCPPEQKQRNSIKLKGRVPWNKGLTCPQGSLALKQYWTAVKEGKIKRGHVASIHDDQQSKSE